MDTEDQLKKMKSNVGEVIADKAQNLPNLAK